MQGNAQRVHDLEAVQGERVNALFGLFQKSMSDMERPPSVDEKVSAPQMGVYKFVRLDDVEKNQRSQNSGSRHFKRKTP